jgi:hypothetical protein
MVVQYILTPIPSQLITLFLPSAKLIMVEHYIFHQKPPTSSSAILASRITVLYLLEKIFILATLMAVLTRLCAILSLNHFWLKKNKIHSFPSKYHKNSK